MARHKNVRYKTLSNYSDGETEEPKYNRSEEKSSGLKLKKSIGIFSGVCLVVGMMIGSGIFVVPIGVLKYCKGDVMLSMFIWALGGVIAMIASLCVCELGASIPQSGSWITFLHCTFGPFFSFLFAWMMIIIASPESQAAQIIALGGYMTKLHFDENCDFPQAMLLNKILGMLVALIVLMINIVKVKWAVRLQIFCTFGKVFALLGISVAGFAQLAKDSSVARRNFFPGTNESSSLYSISDRNDIIDRGGVGFADLSLALYQGLWAFDGFDTVTLVTEEVKNPTRSLPIIMFISVPFVTILYMFVNVAYFSVLTKEEMLTSQAVAVTFGERIHPLMAYMMTLSVCSSLVGSLNANFLATSRLPYIAGRLGHMPEFLSMAHAKFLSPLPAIVLSMALTIVMLFPSNFDVLVTANLLTSWGFRGLTFAGLIYLRKKRPDLARPYKVYLITAIIAIVISIYLVAVPIFFQPDLLYFLGVFLLFVFAIIYQFVVGGQIKMTGIGTVGIFLQKLLMVAPTASSPKV